MESHRLKADRPRDGEWLLEWDDSTLVLRRPGGEPALTAERGAAHRVINLGFLYASRRIGFFTPGVVVTFKKHPAALAAVRCLVEPGLAADPQLRAELRQGARGCLRLGLPLCAVLAGLIGLYCWLAFTGRDPVRMFGWEIWMTLQVVLSLSLGGPFMVVHGLRLLSGVRCAERSTSGMSGKAEPIGGLVSQSCSDDPPRAGANAVLPADEDAGPITGRPRGSWPRSREN